MNKQTQQINPFLLIGITYCACYAIRAVELLVLRTDQGIFGEAFIQKALGIVILVLAASRANFSLKDLGFSKTKAVQKSLIGFGLGLAVFAIAYGSEYFILFMQGQAPSFEFYVSAFTLDGNAVGTTTLISIGMCIFFNILNVVMEEGIFRGLFTKLAQRKTSFIVANVIASLLFGFWHIMLPIRGFVDGDMSAMGAFASGSMYVATSFLMGFQLGLLAKMTNGLWTPMAFHFMNNTIVNMLHVASSGGNDELLAVRLTIVQTISFVCVAAAYIAWRRKEKARKSTPGQPLTKSL